MAGKEAPPDDGGNLGAEPSSHDTCGQFPADEVAATHQGDIPPDPKAK